MNKSEFIDKFSKSLGCTKSDANKYLDAVLKNIASSMIDNDELRFVGFGTFKAKNTKEKEVKTPKGTMAHVPAQRQVRFSVGADFKKTINNK
ncbi:MAG: DNA-binding protein HU-beta [Candidatus Midichloriaceae bacterium]|jgi:DNA-binding protein HU-beta